MPSSISDIAQRRSESGRRLLVARASLVEIDATRQAIAGGQLATAWPFHLHRPMEVALTEWPYLYLYVNQQPRYRRDLAQKLAYRFHVACAVQTKPSGIPALQLDLRTHTWLVVDELEELKSPIPREELEKDGAVVEPGHIANGFGLWSVRASPLSAHDVTVTERATRIPTALIGAAGVHSVVSELSLRGLIALPTIRNTAGVDVVATSLDGSWHANLQVKTSKDKVSFWPIGTNFQSWKGAHNYYVFVRYLKRERRFEAFLESADRVAADAARAEEESNQRGNKPWAPWWPLPKEAAEVERVRRQWLQFGPSQLH